MFIRVIRNLTDHERQSKTNPMVYLKNFQSNRFEKNCKKVISWHYLKLEVKMAMDGAEGIGISFYGHQIFLFQFSLKIIDENQRCMLSDLKNPNFFPKPMYFCRILDSAKI